MKREQLAGVCVLLLLTAGVIFAASGRAAERKSQFEEERAYWELLEAAPLSEVEGETLSSDGRFQVRTAGETDLYVSGVRVPEKVQVVDRDTGEVLWETEGMVRQSALWSPEDGYLALALSARTWCSIMILDTANWTGWEFTLPDGSPIPEYMFPASYEPWGVWRSEQGLELTFEGGNEEVSRFACHISTENGQVTGETLARTVETLPDRYDFNHDGQPETVEITSVGSAHTLRVLNEDSSVLWEEEAHEAHVGWTSIFACSIDGQDCLIRYLPTMYQGFADYSLQVFSLDAAGHEQVLHTGSVTWDCNFRLPEHQYDAEALTEFLWDVRGYLANSTLLMSTESGAFQANLPGLQLQCWPLGETMRADSREALKETVCKVKQDYMEEKGITA